MPTPAAPDYRPAAGRASSSGGTLSSCGSGGGGVGGLSGVAAPLGAAGGLAAAAAAPVQVAAPARGGGSSAGGGSCELLLHGRGLVSLPPELSDPSASAWVTRLDLGGNPEVGHALAARGGLPPLPALRLLALAAAGLRAWPLLAAGGGMAALHTLDLRGARAANASRGAPRLLHTHLAAARRVQRSHAAPHAAL